MSESGFSEESSPTTHTMESWQGVQRIQGVQSITVTQSRKPNVCSSLYTKSLVQKIGKVLRLTRQEGREIRQIHGPQGLCEVAGNLEEDCYNHV